MLVRYQHDLENAPVIETVEFVVNGVTVRGEIVFCCPTDIAARITEPEECRGLIAEAPHIDHYGKRTRTRYQADNAITSRGYKAINCAIESMYLHCMLFVKHLDELARAYWMIRIGLLLMCRGIPMICKDNYSRERRILADKCGVWHIDDDAWERSFHELKQRYNNYRLMKWDIEERFSRYVNTHYGVELSFDVREQLIDKFF